MQKTPASVEAGVCHLKSGVDPLLGGAEVELDASDESEFLVGRDLAPSVTEASSTHLATLAAEAIGDAFDFGA